MKKMWIVAALAVCCLMLLSACGGQKYKVNYEGGKFGFTNAKDSYAAGQKVELVFGEIATDTDYSFYVDGADYQTDWKNGAYVISFTMPDHDVTVRVEAQNSMAYMTPVMLLEWNIPDEADISSDPPKGQVSMQVTGYYGDELKVDIYNRTDETVYYGEEYWLEKKDGDTYKKVEPVEDMVFIEIAYELEAGADAEQYCDLSMYESLVAGEYRLCKGNDLYAAFELYEVWTE